MHSDVVDLRDFYRSRIGQVARRVLRRQIRLMWPNVEGMSVAGLGYPTPYLRPFVAEAERLVALMPAAQGVLHWPDEGPNRTTLVDEADLPFQDASVDRVLLIHALESTDRLHEMLDEVWRVLAAGGRVLVAVPNRRGIWARLDHTPFGVGNPYTAGQLSRLLRDAAFTPVTTAGALYVPPTESRMVLSAAGAWESAGRRWFASFGGIILIEATKQIYARPQPVSNSRKRFSYRPAVTPI